MLIMRHPSLFLRIHAVFEGCPYGSACNGSLDVRLEKLHRGKGNFIHMTSYAIYIFDPCDLVYS
ncbi:hypothetical protein CHELA1G11_11538 [Hyphomicrobiales bacterium]|nr:hypothetical protein CHELA1G11_11538 [Hyphomicrobiales bacterium]CAH1667062.1 hypothetical protein CHELA1G2_12771 [Hyphomicrobiales bacterium]